MGNALRGEADLKVGETTYRLKYDWNAAAEYESLMGADAVLSDALLNIAERRLCARSARALLWAGLRRHHHDVTVLQAGEMMDAAGRKEVMRIVSVALRYYFPELEGEADDSGPDPTPPAP